MPLAVHDEPLTDAEYELALSAVRAVVGHDPDALDVVGVTEDLYIWTRDYGRWKTVDLRMPPDGQRLALDVVRLPDEGAHILVAMWTVQEGPSDLTLELKLKRDAGGLRAEILSLHVL